MSRRFFWALVPSAKVPQQVVSSVGFNMMWSAIRRYGVGGLDDGAASAGLNCQFSKAIDLHKEKLNEERRLKSMEEAARHNADYYGSLEDVFADQEVVKTAVVVFAMKGLSVQKALVVDEEFMSRVENDDDSFLGTGATAAVDHQNGVDVAARNERESEELQKSRIERGDEHDARYFGDGGEGLVKNAASLPQSTPILNDHQLFSLSAAARNGRGSKEFQKPRDQIGKGHDMNYDGAQEKGAVENTASSPQPTPV